MNETHLILGFFTALFVVVIATPSLIKVAKLKHLVDEPGEERKLHKKRIPTIGGIIIFSSFLFSVGLWFPDIGKELHHAIKEFKYLLASLVILFFIGIKDDIIGTAPMKKLIAHIMVAFILVMMGEIKISGMHGLFGIEAIPDWASVMLSVFVYIVLVNAFNLIDGVDGLAAGIGAICSTAFGTWFYLCNNPSLSILAFVLSGALAGFLIFNFSPAKIFMGDSGSLTIGCIISVLAIKMIETPVKNIPEYAQNISLPVLVMSILVYPLIDTLRIFVVRATKGQSPFTADKNHIHHRLLKLGLNHKKTVLTLYLFNILVIAVACLSGFFNATISFFISLSFACLSIALLFLLKPKHNKN